MYCPNCGKELPDGSTSCGFCNQPFNFASPNGGESNKNYVPRPKTWLVESILATLFCCLPFGVVGIVYATKVDSLIQQGLIDEAQKASDNARTWTLVALGCGLAIAIIYGIMAIAGIAAVGSSY